MSESMPVNRPPTETEANLMRALAIGLAAEGLEITLDAAADAIDRLSAAGRVRLHGDAHEACISVGGHVLVRAARDWLCFRAALEDEVF